MAKKIKDNKAVKKAGSLMAEFKAFISRGNVLDLAVGVIIGGAFSAIVTSIVSILMSLCTWGIPGGINGLVTVLPALNDGQTGLAGQCFNVSNLDTILKNLIDGTKIADLDAAKAYIASSYTIYGGLYVFNGAAIINWGAVINAVISFLIIAIVLFIVIKIVASIKKAKADLDAKALEAYYNKHPEERPAPVEEGVPEPTDHELLKGILLELQKKNKEENK